MAARTSLKPRQIRRITKTQRRPQPTPAQTPAPEKELTARQRRAQEHPATEKELAYDELVFAAYRNHIKSQIKSKKTIASYMESCQQFFLFAREQGLPSLPNISREHVELWLVYLRETLGRRPYTVKDRFTTLRLFFRWATEEHEIKTDPTLKMKMPRADRVDKDIVTGVDVARVLGLLQDEAKGASRLSWKRLAALRDASIICLYYDTGCRLEELLRVEVSDIDFEACHIKIGKEEDGVVQTKSRHKRNVIFSPGTAVFLQRYLRALHSYRAGEGPLEVFTAVRGDRLQPSGVYQLIRKRFHQAGLVAKIGPHDLRHSGASDQGLNGSLSTIQLQKLYDWSNPDMVVHYQHQTLEASAFKAFEQSSPVMRALELMPKRGRGRPRKER